MTKQVLVILFYLIISSYSAAVAQEFSGIGKTYPLSVDGSKYVVSGFVPFDNLKDEEIYVNALLWTIDNICPKLRDGITEVNIPAKSFTFGLAFTSLADSEIKNTYHCQIQFRVADSKLIYYLSNIQIESTAIVMKKITPIEKLMPEKKASHKQTMDDFVLSESSLLNKIFDFTATNQPAVITHWNEITNRKPVKGMTETECKLAFGKPQSIIESNGEIQWMYSSSFYIFFRNGKVETIVK